MRGVAGGFACQELVADRGGGSCGLSSNLSCGGINCCGCKSWALGDKESVESLPRMTLGPFEGRPWRGGPGYAVGFDCRTIACGTALAIGRYRISLCRGSGCGGSIART